MKKVKSLLLAFAILLTMPIILSACGGSWKVRFKQDSLSISPSEEKSILDIVEFNGIDASSISFVSSDESVAYVEGNVLIGKKVGRTSLYAKSGEETLAVLKIVVKNKLASPLGLSFDKENSKIVWDSVYAEDESGLFVSNSYTLKILKNDGAFETVNLLNNQYELKEEGAYVAMVMALGQGRFDDSNYSQEITFEFGKMPIVGGLKFNNITNVLSWNKVSGDAKYRVKVNGVLYPEIAETEQVLNIKVAGNFVVSVVAIDLESGGRVQSESTAISINKLKTPEVVWEGGELKWATDEGIRYAVEYSGTASGKIYANGSTYLKGLTPGAYTIKVQAKGGNYEVASEYSQEFNIVKLGGTGISYKASGTGKMTFSVNPLFEGTADFEISANETRKRVNGISAPVSVEIDIPDFGKNKVKARAMASSRGYLNGDDSNIIEVVKLKVSESVVHSVLNAKSVLTFTKVEFATDYSVRANGEVVAYKIISEDDATITIELKDTDELVSNEKILFEVVATSSEFPCLDSVTSKTSARLESPSNVNKNENFVTFNAVPNATGYKYELYKTDSSYNVTGDPVKTESISINSFEVNEGYGYYIVKIFTLGDNDNYLNSNTFERLTFYVSENLEMPNVTARLDIGTGKYVIDISSTDDRITEYEIYIDGVLLNEKALPNKTYYFNEQFSEEKNYLIEVRSIGADNLILIPSGKKSINFFRIESLKNINVNGNFVSFALPSAAIGFLAKVGSKSFTSLPIDVSEFNNFSLDVKFFAKSPSADVFYLDSLKKSFLFERLKAPTLLTYDSGNVVFTSADDNKTYEISVTAVSLNREKNVKILAGETSETLALSKVLVDGAYKYTLSLNELLILACLDPEFAGVSENFTEYKIQVKAVNGTKDGVVVLNSNNATTGDNKTELSIRKLETPSLSFSKNTLSLSIANYQSGINYDIYVNSTRIATINTRDYIFSDSNMFESGKVYEIYVRAHSTNALISKISETIVINRVKAVDSLSILANGTISYYLDNPEWVDHVNISMDGEILDNGVLTSFNYVSGKENYSLQVIGKDYYIENSKMYIFLDSTTRNYTIKTMVGGSQTPDENTVLGGKLNWGNVTLSDWNASNSSAIYYSVEAYQGGELVRKKTNIKIDNILLDEFKDLSSGLYNFKVYAELGAYTLNFNEVGYVSRASLFNADIEIEKLEKAFEPSLLTIDSDNLDELQAALEGELQIKFKGNINTNNFQIYIDDVFVKNATITKQGDFFTYTLSYDFSVSRDYKISIVAISDKKISSDTASFIVTKENSISEIVMTGAGEVTLKIGKAGKFGYLVRVENEGSVFYFKTQTNVFNLLENSQFSKTAGTLKISAIAYHGSNALASGTMVSLITRVLSNPVITKHADKISITSTSLGDGIVTYVIELPDGSMIETNKDFMFKDEWESQNMTLKIYAKKDNAISSNTITEIVGIVRLGEVEGITFKKENGEVIITWDTVSFATEYSIELGGEVKVVNAPAINLGVFASLSSGLHTLKISAKSESAMSSKATSFNFTKESSSKITNIATDELGRVVFGGDAGSYEVLATDKDGKSITLTGTLSAYEINTLASGNITIKVRKLGNLNVPKTENISLDSDYVTAVLSKLDILNLTKTIDGYLIFEAGPYETEFMTYGTVNGILKKINIEKLGDISANTYGVKIIDIKTLFEMTNETFSLGVFHVVNGLIAGDAKAVELSVKAAINVTKVRGQNFAEDYLIIDRTELDTYANFIIEINSNNQISYILQSADVLKGFLTTVNGKNKFSLTLPDGGSGSLVYGIDLAAILSGKTGDIQIKISAVFQDLSVSDWTSQVSVTKLLGINSIALREGEIVWNGVVPNASGYYIYLTNIETKIVTIKYVEGGSVSNFLISEEIIAKSGKYTIEISAVSNGAYLASDKLKLKNEEGNAVEVFKIAAPNKLNLDNGSMLYQHSEFEAVTEVVDLNKLLASLSKDGLYTSPFTYKFANLSKQRITLRFASGDQKFYSTVMAYDLMQLSEPQISILKRAKDSFAQVGNGTMVSAIESILEKVAHGQSYGIANNRVLFDNFGARIPAGAYKVSVMQNAYDTLGWLNSSYGEAVDVYVAYAPNIVTEKIGENYFISFNETNWKNDKGVMELATNYMLQLDSSNFCRVSRNGASYELSVRKKNSSGKFEELQTFALQKHENGRIYINVSTMLRGIVDSIEYNAKLYVEGGVNTVNSHSSNVKIKILATPNVVIKDGVLLWSSQDVSNLITYKPFGRNEATLKMGSDGDAKIVWDMKDVSNGLYEYIKVQALGSISQFAVVVDSNFINLGKVYKLDAPIIGTSFGAFEIDDGNKSIAEDVLDGNSYSDFYAVSNMQGETDVLRTIDKLGEKTTFEVGLNPDYFDLDKQATEFSFYALGTRAFAFNKDVTLNPQSIVFVNSPAIKVGAKMSEDVVALTTNLDGNVTWEKQLGTKIYYKVTIQNKAKLSEDGQLEIISENVFYTKDNVFDFRKADAQIDTMPGGVYDIFVQAFKANEDVSSLVVDLDNGKISSDNVKENSSFVLLSSKTPKIQNAIRYFEVKNPEVNIKIDGNGNLEILWLKRNEPNERIPEDFEVEFTSRDDVTGSVSTIRQRISSCDLEDNEKLVVSENSVTAKWFKDAVLEAKPYKLNVYVIPKMVDANNPVLRSRKAIYKGGANIEMLKTLNARNISIIPGTYKEKECQEINFVNYLTENNFGGKVKFVAKLKIGTEAESIYNLGEFAKFRVFTSEIPDGKIIGTIESGTDTGDNILNVYLGTKLSLNYSIQVVPMANESGVLHVEKLRSNFSIHDPLKSPNGVGTIGFNETGTTHPFHSFWWNYTPPEGEIVTYVVKSYVKGDIAPPKTIEDLSNEKDFPKTAASERTYYTKDKNFMPTRSGLNFVVVSVMFGENGVSNNLTSVPTLASKETTLFMQGDGSSDKPFVIANEGQFENIKFRMYKPLANSTYLDNLKRQVTEPEKFSFKLLSNLELSEFNASTNSTFKGGVFDGVLDGNGKTATITAARNVLSSSVVVGSTSYITGLALFAQNTGTIKNLDVKFAPTFKYSQNTLIGGLAAVNSGTIDNCTLSLVDLKGLTTTSQSKTLRVGGLVGRNSGSVQNCTAYLQKDSSNNEIPFEYSVLAASSNVGYASFVGINDGTIKNCINNSNLKFIANGSNVSVQVAGIAVDTQGGSILECLNKANITAEKTLGSAAISSGIVNMAQMNAEIKYCANTGAIRGSAAAGIVNTISASDLSSCVGVGLVNGVNLKMLVNVVSNQSHGTGNYTLGSDGAGGEINASLLTQGGVEIRCEYGQIAERKMVVTFENGIYKIEFKAV